LAAGNGWKVGYGISEGGRIPLIWPFKGTAIAQANYEESFAKLRHTVPATLKNSRVAPIAQLLEAIAEADQDSAVVPSH
jgi:hypothetical protein